MGTKPKALRRALFGVRASDVEQLLADRELTARTAADQVQAAEKRARFSEERASALEARVAEAAQQRDESEGKPPNQASRATDTVELLKAVREEMARVLHATQEAGSKILERTREGLEHDLEDTDRRRRHTEAERERLQAWTADVGASIVELWRHLTEAGGVLQATRNSVDHAVGSLEAMMRQLETGLSSVRSVLDRFQAGGIDQDQDHDPRRPDTEDRSPDQVPPLAPAPPLDLRSGSPPVAPSPGPRGLDNGRVRDEAPGPPSRAVDDAVAAASPRDGQAAESRPEEWTAEEV